jgi:hypothetical protein
MFIIVFRLFKKKIRSKVYKYPLNSGYMPKGRTLEQAGDLFAVMKEQDLKIYQPTFGKRPNTNKYK